MWNAASGWTTQIEGPITLPNGRVLVKLRDAGDYSASLSKTEANLPKWQDAIEALMLVTSNDIRADWCHARIEPRARSGVQSRPQGASLGRRKLKRDQ
jgi:hypothetical protein